MKVELIVLAAAGLFAAACGDSGPDGVHEPEPGSPDAAPGSPDAGGPDANVDPAALVHVQVRYLNDMNPDPHVRVVFDGPDGKLVADTHVDADGRVEAPLPQGGSVTAVYWDSYDHPGWLFTETNVHPGDTIHFGGSADRGTTTGSLQVAFTPMAEDVYYEVYTPCKVNQSPGSPITALIVGGCVGATMPIELAARDRTSHAVVAVAWLDGVAAVSGTTVTMPPFEAPTHFRRSLEHVPAGVSNCTLFEAAASALGVSARSSALAMNPSGEAQLETVFASSAAAEFHDETVTCRMSSNATTVIVETSLVRVDAWPPAAEQSLDFGALLVPATSLQYDDDGTFHWQLGEGAHPDEQVAEILLAVPDGPGISRWSFHVPGDATSVKAPEMPFNLGPYWQPDKYSRTLQLTAVDVDLWDDFDEARDQGVYPERADGILQGTPHTTRYAFSEI